MKELRSSLLLLLAYIIGLLGIAQIQYVEANFINFEEAFFVMYALAATVGVLLPGFLRPSIYLNLTVWAIIYGLVWLFHWRGMENPPTTLVLGLQFILVELSAGLSHFVGLHLDEVEFLLDGLSAYTYPNRMLNLSDARDRVNTEMMRSRRFNRPLTVLIVQIKSTDDKDVWSQMKSLQRDLLKRFAIAKFGQVISDLARQTDLIIRENNERFMIVCPETDAAHSAVLAERISKAVQNEMSGEMLWGSASFPEESYSLDELFELASQRVGSLPAVSITEHVVAVSEKVD